MGLRLFRECLPADTQLTGGLQAAARLKTRKNLGKLSARFDELRLNRLEQFLIPLLDIIVECVVQLLSADQPGVNRLANAIAQILDELLAFASDQFRQRSPAFKQEVSRLSCQLDVIGKRRIRGFLRLQCFLAFFSGLPL